MHPLRKRRRGRGRKDCSPLVGAIGPVAVSCCRVAAGRNFCDDNHERGEERRGRGREGSVIEAEVGHTPRGLDEVLDHKKTTSLFRLPVAVGRALYYMPLSRSPSGIIFVALFPHDASKTKDDT